MWGIAWATLKARKEIQYFAERSMTVHNLLFCTRTYVHVTASFFRSLCAIRAKCCRQNSQRKERYSHYSTKRSDFNRCCDFFFPLPPHVLEPPKQDVLQTMVTYSFFFLLKKYVAHLPCKLT